MMIRFYEGCEAIGYVHNGIDVLHRTTMITQEEGIELVDMTIAAMEQFDHPPIRSYWVMSAIDVLAVVSNDQYYSVTFDHGKVYQIDKTTIEREISNDSSE